MITSMCHWLSYQRGCSISLYCTGWQLGSLCCDPPVLPAY